MDTNHPDQILKCHVNSDGAVAYDFTAGQQGSRPLKQSQTAVVAPPPQSKLPKDSGSSDDGSALRRLQKHRMQRAEQRMAVSGAPAALSAGLQQHGQLLPAAVSRVGSRVPGVQVTTVATGMHNRPPSRGRSSYDDVHRIDSVLHTLHVQGAALPVCARPQQAHLLRQQPVPVGKQTHSNSGLLGCGVSWAQVCHAAATAGRRCLSGGGSQHHCQQHRLVLGALVAQQWRWLVQRNRLLRAANACRDRRLLAAGWDGWQNDTSCVRVLHGAAALLAAKRRILAVADCLGAWQGAVASRHELQERLQHALHAAHQRTARTALRGWHTITSQAQEHRQLLLRADAARVVASTLCVLRGWHSWAVDRRLSGLKKQCSAQHHRQVLQRRVLGCWRRQVAASDAEWQALAAALCFNKRRLLDTSLRCWRSAVASQAAAVAAARDALQGWRHGNERATCAAMLRAWRQVTVQRSALHSLQQQALAAVRLRRQRAVLRQWAREGAHCRRLRRASAALSQLRRRWQTWHSLARWRGAAAVLAGRRCSELRALVLTRACLGTWLQLTEHRAQRRATLTAARVALRRAAAARSLRSWAAAAAKRAEEKALCLRALEHRRTWLAIRVVAHWRARAAVWVLRRAQRDAAWELRCSSLQHRAWRAWSCRVHYGTAKRRAPALRFTALARTTLRAWRNAAQLRACQQQQMRHAAWHARASLLGRSLAAWSNAVQHAAQKAAMVVAADECASRLLLRRSMAAWRGPVLRAARSKHARMAAAEAHHTTRMQHAALVAWRSAAADSAAVLKAADAAAQRRVALLGAAALQAWRTSAAAAVDKQRMLDAKAAPVLHARSQRAMRRLLAAWRHAAHLQAVERQKVDFMQQRRRRRLLARGIAAWRTHWRRRKAKAAACTGAVRHRVHRMLQAALNALMAHVAAAKSERRILLAAALLRQRWLAARTWRAWRLATAMTRLQQREQGKSEQQHHQHQNQRTGGFMTAISAVCDEQQRWQQRWQARCRALQVPLTHTVVVASAQSIAQPMHSALQPAVEVTLAVDAQEQLTPPLLAVQEQLAPAWESPVPIMGGERQTLAPLMRVRRPPRLPAFLRAQAQQQQPLPLSTSGGSGGICGQSCSHQQTTSALAVGGALCSGLHAGSTYSAAASPPSVHSVPAVPQVTPLPRVRRQPRQLPEGCFGLPTGPSGAAATACSSTADTQVLQLQHGEQQLAEQLLCGAPLTVVTASTSEASSRDSSAGV